MSVFPYQTQAVRDLAWACFAPALLPAAQLAPEEAQVSDCRLHLTPARQKWLEALDDSPGALQAYLAARRSRRVGLYFEHLWHFFLEHDPAVELVAHNLPVRDSGRTLGEFDVIYRCHERQRHVHLELAVKYFLSWRSGTRAEAASQWHEWLGPNARDRLDLKLRQLFQRQIQLGLNPAARLQLDRLGIGDMAREIVIKGCLFQSLDDSLPPPTGFNDRLNLGKWLHLAALPAFIGELKSDRFVLPPKLRWLSPLQGLAGDEFFDRSSLAERLQSLADRTARARLVVGVDAEGVETHRFFVTPDDWPDLAGSDR